MSYTRVLAVVLAAVVLAGCGTSSPATTTAHFTYGPTPSVSARMICRHEAVGDIDESLGVGVVSTPRHTWRAHRYTCTYRYRHGTMVLYVQALPTLASTRAFMTSLGRTLGRRSTIVNVGQGSFATRNGSVVSRKDNKVLVVEVAGLPRTFGHPATSREEVALTVTELIFACWRGD